MTPEPPERVEKWTITICDGCGCVHDFIRDPCPGCQSHTGTDLEVVPAQDGGVAPDGHKEGTAKVKVMRDPVGESVLNAAYHRATERAEEAEAALAAALHRAEEAERERDALGEDAVRHAAARVDAENRAEALEAAMRLIEGWTTPNSDLGTLAGCNAPGEFTTEMARIVNQIHDQASSALADSEGERSSG